MKYTLLIHQGETPIWCALGRISAVIGLIGVDDR
jgi:hypothetical protein